MKNEQEQKQNHRGKLDFKTSLYFELII